MQCVKGNRERALVQKQLGQWEGAGRGEAPKLQSKMSVGRCWHAGACGAVCRATRQNMTDQQNSGSQLARVDLDFALRALRRLRSSCR